MSEIKTTYRIEGQGTRGNWSTDYAGSGASGYTSLREARADVAGLRRLGGEFAGAWRIVRETDGRVKAQWDSCGRRVR